MRIGRGCALPALAAAVLAASVAHAQTAPSRWRTELGIAFGTGVPLSVGGEGSFGLGRRFTTHVALGWLPSPYVNLINEVSVAQGWYDRPTADLIEAALDNSLVAGLALGWRPFRTHGLELRAGYTLATFGGASTSGEVVEAVLGESLPPQAERDVEIDSRLHLYEVGAGWSWRLGAHLHLQTSASFMGCFSATTTSDIVTRAAREEPVADRFEGELNAYLDDTYTTYVKLPVLRVMLGSRF